MALIVVTGPPFAGKSAYARDEIARRESDGELGLILIGFTETYQAIAPGPQSQFRDQAVSDSGAPRLAGYLYATAINEAAERELSGFVTTDSPRRAVEIADRIGAAAIIDIAIGVEQIARRAESHMVTLSRTVPRAGRAASVRRCRDAGVDLSTRAGRTGGPGARGDSPAPRMGGERATWRRSTKRRLFAD